MSEQRPGLQRTGWRDLAVPFVVIGATVYVLLRFAYAELPLLQYLLPLPIAALAVVELAVAGRVRAAVRHDPHARPMTAIAIARTFALGKASSLVGAAVTGAALGLMGRLLPLLGDVRAATHDSVVGLLVLLSGVLLTAAGLVLERSTIDPGADRRPASRP